jgi:hypothetical protein
MASRKKLLIAQSDLQRQTLLLQVAEAEAELARLKKRMAIFGLSSAAIGAGASIAKLFFGRNESKEKSGGGLFSKILSGVGLFRQIKSLFSGIKSTIEPDRERAEL